ncbi:hypothetical protein B9Z55_022896 [Caenorhabditis nigoni]|uniref:Uncharacterized protein n=1 Tax=Caenorhabditis nigoni TaxID=1611254 RepID=A0A2G5SMX5_9PELO|nr:hypothetical protein B9Z55_022896 [Caenorhabditis nigoni]
MTIVPTVAFLEAIDSGSIHRHNEFAHVHHQLREQIFLEFKADFDRKTKENDQMDFEDEIPEQGFQNQREAKWVLQRNFGGRPWRLKIQDDTA